MQNQDANPQPRQHSHILGGQVPALHDADGKHAAPGHGEGGRVGGKERAAERGPEPAATEPRTHVRAGTAGGQSESGSGPVGGA